MVNLPALTLAAFVTLGMSTGLPCHRRVTQPERHLPVKAVTPVPVRFAAPPSSWLDFIDFRHGSGDMLSALGRQLTGDTRSREPT